MTEFRPEQLEQLVKIHTSKRMFTLGMPVSAGCSPGTLLTPEGASILVSRGVDIKAEQSIGDTIHYTDDRYRRAGVDIVSRKETLRCDVILYSGVLTPAEASLLKPHAIVLTMLNNRIQRPETVQILLERFITVIALDEVRDYKGRQPLSDILGEVSGRAAISAATAFLSDGYGNGKGILLGGVSGINPCEVIILGTGMSALAAARSAIGLGSLVRMFDSDPYCLRAAMNELGPAVIGSALHPGVLGHALASADVVIATAMPRGRFSVDESVIDNMKKGVIIFDLDNHNGLSATFPTLRCMDVARAVTSGVTPGSDICLINAAGTVQRTVAMAATNDILPIIDRMFGAGRGLINILKADAGLRNSVIYFRGRIVNAKVAEKLSVKSVDINLMLSFS